MLLAYMLCVDLVCYFLQSRLTWGGGECGEPTVTNLSMPVVPLDKRYTLDNHPPAEWARSVIGAPSDLVFAALTASSMRFRYLQYARHFTVLMSMIISCFNDSYADDSQVPAICKTLQGVVVYVYKLFQ